MTVESCTLEHIGQFIKDIRHIPDLEVVSYDNLVEATSKSYAAWVGK